MSKEQKTHLIKQHAIARVSCTCGWFCRLEELRHKSDDDLLLEGSQEFEIHKDEMRRWDRANK